MRRGRPRAGSGRHVSRRQAAERLPHPALHRIEELGEAIHAEVAGQIARDRVAFAVDAGNIGRPQGAWVVGAYSESSPGGPVVGNVERAHHLQAEQSAHRLGVDERLHPMRQVKRPLGVGGAFPDVCNGQKGRCARELVDGAGRTLVIDHHGLTALVHIHSIDDAANRPAAVGEGLVVAEGELEVPRREAGKKL